jgi:hypothetical protein
MRCYSSGETNEERGCGGGGVWKRERNREGDAGKVTVNWF